MTARVGLINAPPVRRGARWWAGRPVGRTAIQPERNGALKTIGRHVVAELYGCSGQALDQEDLVRQHMLDAAEIIGATIIGETFHKFSPQGVSGTVVIAESHLSIHTWPENGYVAMDVYTCGGLDPRPAMDHMARSLGATHTRIHEIVRGLPEEMPTQANFAAEDVVVISDIAPAKEVQSVS